MAFNQQAEFNPLSDLRPGSTRWAVRVYVSRLWHHRGGTDHGPIKHINMVFLDATGNHMYAEIPDKFVDQFMDRIEEGKIYDIRKFFVFPKKYVFRPVEGHAMIKFTKYTSVVERTGLEAQFPFCTYDLTPMTQLSKPSDMPDRFTDVLGVISGVSDAVQYHSASRTEPSTKRIIHIKDLSGHQITVNLWGETATDFDGDAVIELGQTEPVIVIFVGTLVKTYDGRRGVSGSAACRWYINEDLPDINNFRQGLRGQIPTIQRINLPGQTAAEVDAEVNLETKTVRELLDLDIFDNKDARFFCTVTLTKLSSGQRWWFSSCTTCHRSATPIGTAYKCSDSNCLGTDALPRYRICFVGADDDAETEFVFFDRVGRELLGMPLISLLRHGHAPATSLARIVESSWGNDTIPKELASVVSRKFRFVVSLSNKCYMTEEGSLSFQVHRIDAPLGKQPQSSVFYRASNSGASSSCSEVVLLPEQGSDLTVKLTSTDLTAYKTLSPEMECVLLSELLPGTHDQCVRVRASRVWHYRGGLEIGEVKNIRMVLIDEQGDHIYAVVPSDFVHGHIHSLHETAVYKICNFRVSIRQSILSPVEASMEIRFTQQTVVHPVLDFEDTFPEWTFSLTSFEELPAPSDAPVRLLDVIGTICGLSDVTFLTPPGGNIPTAKRNIILLTDSGHEVKLSLWGEAALRFNGQSILYLGQEETAVAIFVGTVVQQYEGSKQLAGSIACRWYINEDIPEINMLRCSSLSSFKPIVKIPAPQQITLRTQITGRHPQRTLAQLLNHNFYHNGDGSFQCVVTIWRLTPGKQWWYSSCAICKRTATPLTSSSTQPNTYKCSDPDCHSMDATLQYRLCLLCSDGTGEAEFSLVGRVAEIVIGFTPKQVVLSNYRSGIPITNLHVAATRIRHTPPELAAIASKKFKFLIRVTANCFNGRWATFSVQNVGASCPLE